MSHDRNNAIALILAAGRGRRLGGVQAPKVLLEFGGRTLLERRVASLTACGVSRIVLTVGHQADDVRRAAAGLNGGSEISFVTNPRFEEGSLISLAVQREALTSGRPVLVMDGDVLHDSRMVERLFDDAGENILLMDPELEPGDEPVKVCFRGERIVDFRKVPADPGERHGESVGFFRFSPSGAAELSARCDARLDAGGGALEYEEAIRDMILAAPGRFSARDVGDLPWTEIDFPEDIDKARDDVLPQLVD